MLAVEVRFPHGRFHATPWDRHVNEGQPEWPPSPWRLLRALLASWYRLGCPVPSADMQSLLTALSPPPAYHLPATGHGHSRHYVPVASGRSRLLDAFVSVDQSGPPLTFVWPEIQLSGPQEKALDALLLGVPYLGRAESTCLLVRTATPAAVNSRPLVAGEESHAHHLLCASPQVTLEQLGTDTHSLRTQGLARPPSSRWVAYQPVGRSVPVQAVERPYHIAVFLLEKPVARVKTLALADRLRRALLTSDDVSATLTGRDNEQSRQDGHRHLHILPQGPDHNLNQVVLFAPEGFSPEDLAALRTLQKLPRENGRAALTLIPWSLAGEQARAEHFGLAAIWRSYTPYLLARHPKTRGRDSIEDQVRRECALRALPRPEIRVLGECQEPYVRRRGPRRKPPGPAVLLELTFPEYVLGPLCLGASSHFGMGRFLPGRVGD